MELLLPDLTDGEVGYALAQREAGPFVCTAFVPHRQERVRVESEGSDAGANVWVVTNEQGREGLMRLLLLSGWAES